MRCSRHNKVRCTYPACIREAAAGAVDGPSVDDYGIYPSPGYSVTVDPNDGALAVQVGPGAYVDMTPAPDTTPAPDPTPSCDPTPAPDTSTPDTSYSMGDF